LLNRRVIKSKLRLLKFTALLYPPILRPYKYLFYRYFLTSEIALKHAIPLCLDEFNYGTRIKTDFYEKKSVFIRVVLCPFYPRSIWQSQYLVME